MLSSFPEPVLALAPDVLKDLEGREALSSLWGLFTKCKESLQDGRRLENISWRLWYAELNASQSSLPSTPSFDSSVTSSHLSILTDDEKDVLHPAPLLTPIAPPTPSSPTGRHRSPSPQPPSSVVSSSHLSVSDIPPARARRSSSVGKIICDLLPDKLVVPHSPSAHRTLTSEEPPSHAHKSQVTPAHSNSNASATGQAPRPSVTVPLIHAPVPPAHGNGEVSPPSTITTAASTPQPSGLFPRVVIVNPTPHPTPPATPQMPANAAAPFLVAGTCTTLLPPAHPLARPFKAPTLPLPLAASGSGSGCDSRKTPGSEAAAKKNDETLKASDRRRFYLHQSESPDKDSPERASPTPSPASDKTVFDDDLDEADILDGPEPGSAVSHSSATSGMSSQSRHSNAKEGGMKRGAAAAGAKGKKGKEVATKHAHGPQRPVLHRMHTAGGGSGRAGHLTMAKRSASTANVAHGHVIGMERTKSGQGTGRGVKVPVSPTTTSARSEGGKEKEDAKGKGKEKEKEKEKEPEQPKNLAKKSMLAEQPARDSPTKGRAVFKVGSSSSNGTDSVAGNGKGDSPEWGQTGHVYGGARDLGTKSVAAISSTSAAVPRQVPPLLQNQAQPKPLPPPTLTAQAGHAQVQVSASKVKPPSTTTSNGKPASQRRGIIVSTSSEYETTDTEGEEDDSWESEDATDPLPAVQTRAQQNYPNNAAHLGQHPQVGHRHVDQNQRTAAISAATKEKIRIQEAALEAQRQREMFAKLPKRSYSNLQRTQSGLLSQLLNPDPAIFPPEHPYGRRSAEDVAARARGLGMTGFSMTPMHGNGVGAPKLQTSKSSASVAEAAPVQVQAKVSVPTAGPSKPKAPHLQEQGGYRPKGMPNGVELEYETDSEGEEDGENGIQVSKSLAQQKLAALAGPHRRTSSGQVHGQQPQQQELIAQRPAPVPPNVANRQLPEKPPPPMSSRVHTDPTPPRPDRPVLTTVATAPIPLNHPYNLPAPAPPMTPRTTRRQMLATELSESLRRNLLWERQVSKVNMIGRRSGAVLGGTLRPLTTANVQQLQQQQAQAQGQAQVQEPPQVQVQAQGEGSAHQAPKTREEEREERRKQAMARNRSWADDYHYSGW